MLWLFSNHSVFLSPTCAQEEVMSNDIVFQWPETAGGSNASFICPNNRLFTVSRKCFTDGQWGRFDDKGCGVLASEFEDISGAAQNVRNQITLSLFTTCYKELMVTFTL